MTTKMTSALGNVENAPSSVANVQKVTTSTNIRIVVALTLAASAVIIGYRRRTAPYADEIEPYVRRDDKVSTQYDKLLDVHADGATYGVAL